MTTKQKKTSSSKSASKSTAGFSDAEKQAMKDRAKELKAEAKRGNDRAKGEAAVQEAISEMAKEDAALATKIHSIVSKAAPDLMPKTWYGMPAYANGDGKVVCFFKSASKFETRYCEFGFNEVAALDDGSMWPTAFAVTKVTGPIEQQLRALVTRAIG